MRRASSRASRRTVGSTSSKATASPATSSPVDRATACRSGARLLSSSIAVGSYEFPDNLAWEQSFFFDRGWSCIRHDGIGHVRVVAYNVLDLGFTTTPWPQSTEGGLHGLVDATNTMYGLVMLPVLVAALTGGFRRELILAAHLAAVIATALLFYGDPRFRIPSDALGIILTVVVIESALPRSDVRAVGELEP